MGMTGILSFLALANHFLGATPDDDSSLLQHRRLALRNDYKTVVDRVPQPLKVIEEYDETLRDVIDSDIMADELHPVVSNNNRGGAKIEINLPNGKWIRDPDKKHFAPICCGSEGARYLQHPNECGTEPMPKGHNNLYSGRNDFLAHTGGHGCECPNFHDEYTWVDKNLPQFDASKTCQQLNERRVLMIGDSTMLQTASTLMNALFPGGCQTQLFAVYGDTLVNRVMGGFNRGREWVHTVKGHFSNTESGIVILSAGAHVNNSSNFEIVMNYVIWGSKEIKQMYPNMQIVWKTLQPGGCTQNISSEIYSGNDYNHGLFYEWDMYALSVLPQHGIHVIDMRMLYYRSDAHRPFANDCLHFCVPGPLDVIAPLFSQLLDQLS
jgi:hypothetical protein